MKASRFPDSLVLIFGMILAAQLVSYVLPAGKYERVLVGEPGHQREQVVGGTFHEVEAPPVPAFAFLTAIPRGMTAAADIIFFVFIVGGAIGVIRATGAIDALISMAIRKFGDSPALLVAGTMTLFALGSSTIGMAEEYMPFIPVLVAMCLALKMDAIVALGLVYVGAGIGYGCAALNPFTVVIAQRIAGLPLYSGQLLRWSLFVICLAVGIHHLLRYARRVSKDPQLSLVADLDFTTGFDAPQEVPFSPRRAGILICFASAIGLFVFGVARWGWFLTELGAVFLGLAVLAAILGGLGPNHVAREFGSGAAELTSAALIIGFARTIEVVLDDASIKDTVIHGIAGSLENLPAALSASGMLLVQSVFNFFIPSGSGQAYVTMPIMAPLADLTGVSRQTAVLAYQFGDGFTNMIVPTNALLMGMLALGRVPYPRWARFIVPLLVKLYVIAIAALVLTVAMGV